MKEFKEIKDGENKSIRKRQNNMKRWGKWKYNLLHVKIEIHV